ncbi:MAG: oxidoreductase [Cyclobacteriaceae bacterium]|nr:MAG: oxidoreductase [Cyclobacteriaceae bacterium]
MPKYNLNINRAQTEVKVEADTPLLYVLRDHLELNGPKFGCGVAQCGSCLVLIDGEAVVSCTLPVSSVGKSEITTLEGLAGKDGKLHAVQEAFVKEQAAQCGYCLNGMIMSTVSMLNKNPDPEEDDIKKALQLNLCRCGAHTRMIKAVETAKNL